MSEALGAISETFLMLFAIGLLFIFFYMMGKYRVFTKVVLLSEIYPSLENIEQQTEEEKEWQKLRRLITESFNS